MDVKLIKQPANFGGSLLLGEEAPNGLVLGASVDINSDESYERANTWLETSISQHPGCRITSRSSTTKHPARLLKIPTGDRGERVVCLIKVEADSQPYTALSYCWGGEQEVQTTRRNTALHFSGIGIDVLPATIRDAITVTRRLGLEYLWVDALCIIQDDEDDKARDIDSMADIYAGTVVVIAASRAQTVHDGFLKRLPPFGTEYPRQVFRVKYDDGVRISDIVLAPTVRYDTDYLSERGWAFQERLCARRIFRFGSKCVSWGCHETVVCDREYEECEAFGESLAETWRRGWGWSDAWEWIVYQFTKRKLTIPQDRLRAVAGIAERIKERLIAYGDDVYLAGLWDRSSWKICCGMWTLFWTGGPAQRRISHQAGLGIQMRNLFLV